MQTIITVGNPIEKSFGPFQSRAHAVEALQKNGWNTPDQYDHFWVFGEIPIELGRKKMCPTGATTAVIKEIPELNSIGEFVRLCRPPQPK
ncbi:MAG: hypothetical protein Q7R64_04935 [bacterium]|nr:hypothetical protein [bacterium]